jgi:hypothetical protein
MLLTRLLLALFAVINLGRGAVHAFAADGGAHSIAGLDLSGDAVTIISLFASIGLMQASLGGFELWAVLRRPELVIPLLALQTLQTGLGVIHLWLYRPLPVVVPGAGFNLALLGLLAIGWGLILTRKGRNP